MAIPDNLDAEHWHGWEIDPSTRTSVHPYTKYVPFFGAVGTNGNFTPDGGSARTSLITVDTADPAHNLVTNPRIEATDVSMFTAVGLTNSNADLTRSTAQQAIGAASLLASPTGSAAGEGFYWTSSTMPGNIQTPRHITASCEVRGASASGSVKISIQDASGTELAYSATHNLTTTFTKISVSYAIPFVNTPVAYRVAVVSAAAHTTDWYTDKIMVEGNTSGIANTYVDGAVDRTSSGQHYEWISTANASASRVRAGIRVIRGVRIKNDSANPLYVGIDTDLTTDNLKVEGIQVLQSETFETNFPIDARSKITVRTTGGNSTVHGVVWGLHEG